jgi:uncharacterized protein with GYD domain
MNGRAKKYRCTTRIKWIHHQKVACKRRWRIVAEKVGGRQDDRMRDDASQKGMASRRLLLPVSILPIMASITSRTAHSGVNQRREPMPIFMMFGKYTPEAMRNMSPQRTDQAVQLIQDNGGKVISMYAVMGEHDLVFTLDFADAESAFATSVALNKMTGIAFTTSPVVEVEMFDRLIAKAKTI